MIVESSSLERRAARYAALGEPARLEIVDLLTTGDLSPSELASRLGMTSNLLAHHLKVLETAGVVARRRSEGDHRRSYLRLLTPSPGYEVALQAAPERVLFVCTANSARSHLAAALWRQASSVPVASAGTHPADAVSPGAVDAARRHHLPMPQQRPKRLDEVTLSGDLVVTVCDRAREELGDLAKVHWSIPDPVPTGTSAAFDDAYEELDTRVADLAKRLPSAS